jgi:hypothetical protein
MLNIIITQNQEDDMPDKKQKDKKKDKKSVTGKVVHNVMKEGNHEASPQINIEK